MFFIAAFWFGCGESVVPLYESTRADALAEAGVPPSVWKPDIILRLSAANVDDLVKAALIASGTFSAPMDREILGFPVHIEPNLTISSLDLDVSKSCDQCLAVDTVIKGDVAWKVMGSSGTVPVTAKVGADLELATIKRDGEFIVTGAPRNVRKVSVNISGVDASIGSAIEGTLSSEIKKQLAALPPQELGQFGGTDVPLLAVRPRPTSDGGLQIDMLSASPSPTPVAAPSDAVDKGFMLYMSQDSLLDLARAAAFRAGPVSHDIVIEPTSLTLDGDTFTMGLRFWKPVGLGWWRDYTTTGTVSIVEKRVQLTPKTVVEGERSKGAGLVDPLSLLAEGLIVKAIEDGLNTSVPASSGTTGLGYKISVGITGVEGTPDTLSVQGDVRVVGASDKGSLRTGGRRR